MLEQNGYLRLVDFGVCKRLKGKDSKAHTIVGTPEYLPPEIIIQKGHNMSADWWSFGVFIYEMIVGTPPFYSKNQHQMFCQIIKEDFQFPVQLNISNDCKDLVRKLLIKNPDHRLGSSNDADPIRDHPWFSDLDFTKLEEFKIPAPYIPPIADAFDVSRFAPEFIGEDPRHTKRDSDENLIVENFKPEFQGFDYNAAKGDEEKSPTK